MNKDKQSVTWLLNQFDEDGDLKNITFEISNYIRDNVKSFEKLELLHNLLKAIRQDTAKLHLTTNKMSVLQMHNQAKDSPIRATFLSSYGDSSIPELLSMDLEYFFIKYRSIIDYSVDFLVAMFPQLKNRKYNLEDKLNYLHDIFDDKDDFSKKILTTEWFDDLRRIRNHIVHRGAGCLVFPVENEKEILFQVYDTNLDELLNKDEIYKYNDNVYYFNRIYVTHIAGLFLYLDTLFKAIISKKENITLAKVERDITSKYPTKMLSLKASHLPNENCNTLFRWSNAFLQIK